MDTIAAQKQSKIKVLSKKRSANTSDDTIHDSKVTEISPINQHEIELKGVNSIWLQLRPEREAKAFKLVEERDWTIVGSEPPSESVFFSEGHSAISIISVIGPTGVGKTSLLNKIAGRQVFEERDPKSARLGQHLTRGIDIYSTYHRILLDCQPLLSTSVLRDFLLGNSCSQFNRNSLISDPLTSCHMISLQLATFLLATSDYVIVLFNWLVDVHFLKLISSAMMLVGEENLRGKFVIFCKDKSSLQDVKLKSMIEKCLGAQRVEKFVCNEEELYSIIAPYSTEKLNLHHEDPQKFTGKNWLKSCEKMWNSTIRSSTMFSDYAQQEYNSGNCLT